MAENMTVMAKDRRRRRLRVVLLVVLLGLLVSTRWTIYPRYFGDPRRFGVVDAGKVFRSAQPKLAQIDHLVEERGLKTILVVRSGESSGVPDEMEYARSRGVKVVHIPIESRQPIPEKYVREFFEVVDDPANLPALVHCSAGRHRTGYLCALYRIERKGWTVERALEEMLSFGFNRESQSVVEKQLREYVPGRGAAARMEAGE